MASAWASSWASAWGDSWGVIATASTTVTTGGHGGPRRRKKRGKVIRYSDFDSRETYEKALAAALAVYVPAVPEVFEAADDDEDDEALLQAVILTLMH